MLFQPELIHFASQSSLGFPCRKTAVNRGGDKWLPLHDMCLEKDLSFQILAMQHLNKIQVALQYQVELQLLVPAAPAHLMVKFLGSTLQLGKNSRQ